MIYTSILFYAKKYAKSIGTGNAILKDVADKYISRTVPAPNPAIIDCPCSSTLLASASLRPARSNDSAWLIIESSWIHFCIHIIIHLSFRP
ncbi:MAG: hypothetical protein ACD_2C00025G0008 [uncultured bacterium (gcode 4)]|uniref:Uncharacterized protein n=1 Tax=uncultured bacterium (gcode 4) TaxID=1234023 RepID=K2G797_9BACT|nr:MAG: hypothetical protein ACD_2C00025G0008 [uncultured bacterium (gcode 4)]